MHWLRKDKGRDRKQNRDRSPLWLDSQSKLQDFVDEAPPGGGASDKKLTKKMEEYASEENLPGTECELEYFVKHTELCFNTDDTDLYKHTT